MNVLICINDNIFSIATVEVDNNSIKSNVSKFTEDRLIYLLENNKIKIENIELLNGEIRTYGAKKGYTEINSENIIILIKRNNEFICIDQYNSLLKLSENDLTYKKIINAKIVNGKVVPFKGTFNKEDMQHGKKKIQRRSNTYVRANSGCNSGICEQRSREGNKEISEQGTVGLHGRNASKSVERSAERKNEAGNTSGLLLCPRPVSGETFYKQISEFKRLNKNAAAVDLHDIEEYTKMKCLLYDNGNAGVAVEESGNIVSVFKKPQSSIKGFALKAVQDAINNGGIKLDCYATNGILPNLYMKAGMRPVCKIKFNREFAPDGWNFERDGEPDIVFMIKGKNTHDFYADYTDDEVPYIYDSDTEDSYTLACRFRDNYYQKETKKKLQKGKTCKDLINAFRRD